MDIIEKRKQTADRVRRFREREKHMETTRVRLEIESPLLWALKQINDDVAIPINDLHTANLMADGFKCPPLKWTLNIQPQISLDIKLHKQVFADLKTCRKPKFPSWVVEWMLVDRMEMNETTGCLDYVHPSGQVVETSLKPVTEEQERERDRNQMLAFRHFCKYENRLRIMKIHKLHLNEQPDWDVWHQLVDRLPPPPPPPPKQRPTYPPPSMNGLDRQRAAERKYEKPAPPPRDGNAIYKAKLEIEASSHSALKEMLKGTGDVWKSLMQTGLDHPLPETPQEARERAQAAWKVSNPDVPWEVLLPKDQQFLMEKKS